MSVVLALETPSFLPHGYCYLWQPGLLGLHVVSDSIITLAYYAIPAALVWFVRRRRDVPFTWMFWLFAIFIAGCGTTHLLEIWTLWHPDYWVSGAIKAVTAAASIGTAVAAVPLLPRAVGLPSPTQLAEANRELREANRELEHLSYSVSHDLRAPLRAIDGFARMLDEDHAAALNPEAHRLLDVIRGNTVRMGQLIDDLLQFSRLSRRELEPTAVDLGALAQGVVDELSHANDARRVAIAVGPLPQARGDRGLLRQVLVQLIGNAFKFTRGRPDARIDIGARREGGEMVYYVRDNGVGFDMRYANKLFGIFQRLHRVDEFEGSGVGLALVQRIVHRHGGRVWAEGRANEGATFYFTLPEQR
ncbi:MAG TPA: ATP-binding protein [Gemmatimonadales bacterium]|nr:ATP-binding protein [Gemmatimonadales bacterium]